CVMALSCPVEDGENGDPPGVLPQVRVAYPGSCAVGPGPALLPLPARPRRLARRGGPDRQCPQQKLPRAARPAPVARCRAAAPPPARVAGRACFWPLRPYLVSRGLSPSLTRFAALLLWFPLSRSLLPPAAVPWAILLFAFPAPLARHACEAKPYSSDVLAAV